mmetsp:Transcript_7533/g.12820  ORF Transcript_7533/g.12820 Transcript_7533/m.12820 type:complete len:510 (+) Transcript_7533:117-1646(+)
MKRLIQTALIVSALLALARAFQVAAPSRPVKKLEVQVPTLQPRQVADGYSDIVDSSHQSSEQQDSLLLSKFSYLVWKDQMDIQTALNIAKEVLPPHELEKSKRVASILSDLEMDRNTIIAGILHGMFSNTASARETIRSIFGSRVFQLLENAQAINRIENTARSFSLSHGIKAQKLLSDNLMNLILCVSTNWDSLLLKLVFHLEELQDLIHASPKERKLIARQALDLYGPLAHRMGAYQLKNEIEALGFKYLYPRSFKRVSEHLHQQRLLHKSLLSHTMQEIQLALEESAVLDHLADEVTISGRVKEPLSMWKKMVQKKSSLDLIQDAVAVRIIVKPAAASPLNDDQACYLMNDIVHSIWESDSSRCKDYIRSPKKNGYQSLHATMNVPHFGLKTPVEVQIRTSEMHQTAEYGKAAHFTYKSEGSAVAKHRLQSSIASGRQLIEVLHNDLREKQVFVFGPQGNILAFQRGATISDLSRLLTHTTFSTRINGHVRTGNYQLGDGDVVSFY